MKQTLLEVLKEVKEDAKFFVYFYTPDGTGTFRSDFKEKSFVQDCIEKATEVTPHPSYNDVVMVSEHIGLSTKSFEENIYYETTGVDGFMNYVSKHNQYYNIFIKLDKENKTITFKLGDKEKTLELLEHGFDSYVSKPYRQKYMICDNANELEKHINDESWNPRMVSIGRKVLKLDKVVEKQLKKTLDKVA